MFLLTLLLNQQWRIEAVLRKQLLAVLDWPHQRYYLTRYCGGAPTQTTTSGPLAVLASTPQDAPRSPSSVAGLRLGPQ
jgi:hypothetical protein